MKEKGKGVSTLTQLAVLLCVMVGMLSLSFEKVSASPGEKPGEVSCVSVKKFRSKEGVNGVEITWEPVENATEYTVYGQIKNSPRWTEISGKTEAGSSLPV